ncbi:MAG TPA: hypothetical protein VFD36_20570 [Kofleriaceae bacterium]|nr:hypothetical protein [Kofleriaceae bacterium]
MNLSAVTEEDARTVACNLCGAGVGSWCSFSRARALGKPIDPGDWRAAHYIRKKTALRTIVAGQTAVRGLF